MIQIGRWLIRSVGPEKVAIFDLTVDGHEGGEFSERELAEAIEALFVRPWPRLGSGKHDKYFRSISEQRRSA